MSVNCICDGWGLSGATGSDTFLGTAITEEDVRTVLRRSTGVSRILLLRAG